MDFDKKFMEKHNYGKYESLDPMLLPKFYIAYRTDLSKVSGKVLNDVKSRYDKGDQEVIDTLARIAEIAKEGRDAILGKDHKRLHELMDENFNCRSKIMKISDPNWELVNTARKCGASAKFTGSGGSIIGMYKDDKMLNELVINLKKIKARVIKPFIS